MCAALSAAGLVALPATAHADDVQPHSSSLDRYQIYVQPVVAGGATTGMRVYISIGALRGRPTQPSDFVGVCVSATSAGTCPATGSRAWAWSNSAPIGSWVTLDVSMNCADATPRTLMVVQPYVQWNSNLNIQPWDSPPSRNGVWFHSGSGDSAVLSVQRCRQVYY